MSTTRLSRSFTHRGAGFAMIAALVMTMVEPPTALAGPVAPPLSGGAATAVFSTATDFSAARRRRQYRHGGNAAGLAFMGLAIGAIGAFAAQQRRNDYYDNSYGPGYAPGYYGGGLYYRRRYYR